MSSQSDSRSDRFPQDEPRVFEPVRDCWILTGATASGKTGVGLELAERIGAEIISLDSMAVYRGMDVGTAKPTLEQRRRVPHHLIDIISPDEEFSLSQYLTAAHETIGRIRARGRQVLFVGGTPLYLKALLRGLYPGPPADWEFRRGIEEELKTAPIETLHERLRQVDPLSAARLHPRDRRRVIRALEVHALTGSPLSHRQTQFDEPSNDPDCRVACLQWPRERLHERIATRVDGMFAAGLVAEVRGLLARHGRLGRTALQALGYREVIDHVHGAHDLPATIELVKTRTRQFARRQDTWFRSLSECRRLLLTEERPPHETAERIVRLCQEGDPG